MLDFVELYKLQYERIAQHENQRLAFSNLVIAITAAALAFATETKLQSDLVPFLLLTILLVIINVTAIQFITKSRFWIKHHQARAHAILHEHLPEAKKTISSVEKINSDNDVSKRPNLQRNLHISIIVITIAYSLFIIWPKISPIVCSA